MEMQMELKPQPHVLLLPFPAQGHIKPMLALAQLLCHAGIHVTFLNTEHNHRQLTQRQALSTRFPTLHFHSISDGLPSDHPRSISPNLMDIVTSLRSKTAPLLHQLLISLMSKNDVGSAAQLPPLGCVITDGIMCFAIEAAEEVGIPVIALRTTSACSFWCYSCIPKLIEEAQLPFGGNKNYLPDALTRELAMFNRRDDDDEGRNPRSRRAGKEHEDIKDPKEKILKRFLLSPKGLATTDQSQGKGLASPSQTADGKGSSRPLTAVALPKSKPTPSGVINVFNYELRTFDTPVFRTGRRLAYHQKAILDNLLFAFQERSSGLMFPALFALAEELYENGRPQFEEIQQSAVKKEKINFLENPESARVPIMALTESDWHEFHNLIERHNSEDLVPPIFFIFSGSYVGRYLVNVQSEHPQEHKLWLVENGFVHNLWTKTNDDLKGLPPIIVNTVKNVRKTDGILRLKFRSTPPEWIRKANGEVEYIFHIIM